MSADDAKKLVDLRPCPHCGGPARLEEVGPGRKVKLWFRVRCEDYDCGGTTWAMLGPEAATTAWNRRDGQA